MTDTEREHWEPLHARGGKVHVEDGWRIRRTYTVGQPGEVVERWIPDEQAREQTGAPTT